MHLPKKVQCQWNILIHCVWNLYHMTNLCILIFPISIPLTESVRMQEETEHGLSCGETVSVSKMCDQLWACEVHIFRSTLYLGPFYLHKFNLFTLFGVHITLEEIFMMYIRYKYIKKFWIMILKMCTVTKVAQAFEKWWKWALPRPVTWWKWALPRPVTWHPDFWGV